MVKAQLSIATFNLKNLNVPGRRIHRDAAGLSKDDYNAKVGWTANALRDLQADVIGFQELWHPEALSHVFEIAGLSEQYALRTKPGSDGDNIQTAIAVRKPHTIEDAEWVTTFPDRFVMRTGGESAADTDYTMEVRIREFSRPVLHAKLAIQHGDAVVPLHVFVIHLKSKLGTQLSNEDEGQLVAGDAQALGSALSAIRRTAEATALRMLLNEQHAKDADASEPVVVVGDYNDGQHTTTTSIVSAEPAYKFFAASRTGERSRRGLYAAAALQQLRSLHDVYFTHIHEGVHESLDHILASQHFYDHSHARIWSFRQMRVLNDELDSESDAKSVPHSDHAPVVAIYDYKPRRPGQ